MNRQEFEHTIKWNDTGIGSIEIFIPMFNKEIQFDLFSDLDNERVVSDKMFKTVEDVLNLPATAIENIKDLLWEECNFSFTVADYGCRPNEGETNKEAHFREFGINNKDTAFEKSLIKKVQINYGSDELQGRYAEIKVETVSDNYISIIVKNGKIIDYDDDGTYLGWFETDEKKAHHDRMKVLNA